MTFLENVDKKQLQKILIIAISALTLVAMVLLLVVIILGVGPKAPIKVDIDFGTLKVTDKELLTGSLILADQDHPYTANEELMELVGCQTYRNEQMTLEGIPLEKSNNKYIPYKPMQLEISAMVAAHKMLCAAKDAVGEKAVTIDAAYGYIIYTGVETDEYNTGMLMFLSDYSSETGAYVALSDAYSKWFDKNAVNYGFIESFEDAYRYVGVAHAKYMTDADFTLAEYIEHLKTNTNYEKMLVVEIDDVKYASYYVACTADDEIKVPANNEYVISGTNEGGVVITVKLDK